MQDKLNADYKQANILVVDDESANVKLLSGILKINGYQNVVCTQDPCQALALYQQHHSDLILLDINMPILDGYGVMDQLNKVTNYSPPSILVLTAQGSQDFCQRALDNGARDYVTKPFDINELLSRIRNLLEVQIAHKFMQHQNEILESRVQERTEELVATRLQVVRYLGRAAEYRDNETGLHIIRMSKMCVLIAKAVGLDEKQCELLLHAAPMHDIGKIGIPDQILLKPGRLSPEEWDIMQTHSQIGADILTGDDSELMKMAHAIALTHHEKYNGKGYPNSLKGEAIPLVGRITAIADVFDALTSKRPYKEAWPIEKAVNLIKQESGEHFDPKLVEHFVNLISEFVAISTEYAESEE